VGLKAMVDLLGDICNEQVRLLIHWNIQQVLSRLARTERTTDSMRIVLVAVVP
jgi:hypothetical protein